MNAGNAERNFGGNDKKLRRLTDGLLKELGVRGASAAVFLLDGRKLAQIKRKYTGEKPKKAVDVLAFPEVAGFPNPEGGKRFLGEIYINRAIAGREPARARLLLVHGLLHLLGYTHDKKSDTLRMQRKEGELLSSIPKP